MPGRRRKADQPMFLLACETNPNEIDLNCELPDVFDTLEEAITEAERENQKWGVGGAIYECNPVWRIAAIEDGRGEAVLEAQLAAVALESEEDTDLDNPEGLTVPHTYEVGPDELGPKRIVRVLPDDPGWDATDGAHPAWWRGSDAGVEGAVAAINKVLDNLEQGQPHTGHFSGASLEALKRRLELLLLKEKT
jgi:hypothetical protein